MLGWEKGRGGSIVPLCQSRPGQSVTWPCLPPTESRRCRPASERWISQVRNESTAWQPCHGHGQHAPSFPGHLVRSWDERLRNASAESRRPGRHPEECHQCPPTKTRPPPSDHPSYCKLRYCRNPARVSCQSQSQYATREGNQSHRQASGQPLIRSCLNHDSISIDDKDPDLPSAVNRYARCMSRGTHTQGHTHHITRGGTIPPARSPRQRKLPLLSDGLAGPSTGGPFPTPGSVALGWTSPRRHSASFSVAAIRRCT